MIDSNWKPLVHLECREDTLAATSVLCSVGMCVVNVLCVEKEVGRRLQGSFLWFVLILNRTFPAGVWNR